MSTKSYRNWTYCIRRDADRGHWFDIHDERGVLQQSSWADESAKSAERWAKQTIDSLQAKREREATNSSVVTEAFDGTFTVHCTHYARSLSVKSTLWPTKEAAEAEGKRIIAGWSYGTSAMMASGGVA